MPRWVKFAISQGSSVSSSSAYGLDRQDSIPVQARGLLFVTMSILTVGPPQIPTQQARDSSSGNDAMERETRHSFQATVFLHGMTALV
jgi:hypothetical protein